MPWFHSLCAEVGYTKRFQNFHFSIDFSETIFTLTVDTSTVEDSATYYALHNQRIR